MRHRRLAPTLLALAASALAVAGCGGTNTDSDASAAGGRGGKLSLVAYSTPREAYEELTRLYAGSGDGDGVSFRQSYGASGDQARAVIAGLPADVVALSLEPDITKLVDENLVAEDWKSTDEHGGFVTRSVVVLAVRKGNPKRIRGWDDLLKPGVQVLTPNPFTSGGARWNVMAAYGAQRRRGRTDAQAIDYLRRLFDQVVVQDKSARESLQTFASGKGDVLIAYENEALTAQAKGEDLDYVIPGETILIENPIATLTEADNPRGAERFVDWLRSEQAQRVFMEKGYRPVVDRLRDERRFPTPPRLFDIGDVGGWSAVTRRFFDPDDSVMATIERGLGVGSR